MFPRTETIRSHKSKAGHIYCASNWLQLPIRAQSWCSLGSILLVVMLHLLLEECIHDKPLHKIVRIMQCLSSCSIVQFQQHLLNLSCCDSFSIRSPYCCNGNFSFAGSSQSKGTSVLITLSTSEELDCPITMGLPVLS